MLKKRGGKHCTIKNFSLRNFLLFKCSTVRLKIDLRFPILVYLSKKKQVHIFSKILILSKSGFFSLNLVWASTFICGSQMNSRSRGQILSLISRHMRLSVRLFPNYSSSIEKLSTVWIFHHILVKYFYMIVSFWPLQDFYFGWKTQRRW